jgi:hypothetical protein
MINRSHITSATLSLLLLAGQTGWAVSQPAVMSFPEVRLGSTAKARVEIANPSDRVVRIENIEVSCTCLRVEGAPQTLEPGAKGEILLAYDPTQVGPTELTMLVQTDRAADPIMEFHWSGQVAAAAESLPANPELFHATPDEVRAAAGSGRLYDVRAAADFALCHVSGAQNRPLSVLSSMPLMPGDKVVIYGSGADDSSLLRFAAGRSGNPGQPEIQVLAGGLRQALPSGLTVTGAAANSAEPAMVRVDDFHRNRDRWVIVGLSAGGPDMPPLPEAARLNGELTGPAVAEKLQTLSVEHPGRHVLIVSSLGEGYDSLEKRLPTDAAVRPFYLAGGLKAYHAHVADLEARTRSRQITLVSRSDPNNSVTVSRKPCGTCP